MSGLFVDTAGWIACADESDAAHRASVEARDRALKTGHQLVTSDFVADETLTLLRLRLGLAVAAAWWQQVNSSPRVTWQRIDAARFDRAREMFFRYSDKAFSFTDCTSFVVMRELRLTRVMTTDRHFRQAGFILVPNGSRGKVRLRRP